MAGFRLLTGFICALAAYACGAGAAGAAEPALTPRPAGTPLLPALTAVGVPKGEAKLDPSRPLTPPPRLPAPLGPPLFGAGGGSSGGFAQSPAAIIPVAPPSPVRQPPAPRPLAPQPLASPRPPKVAPSANANRKQSGAPSGGKFAEWENGCTLPEDLDKPPPAIAAGSRLRARVDSFQRAAPSCNAHIRGVLLEGETV